METKEKKPNLYTVICVFDAAKRLRSHCMVQESGQANQSGCEEAAIYKRAADRGGYGPGTITIRLFPHLTREQVYSTRYTLTGGVEPTEPAKRPGPPRKEKVAA